MKNLFTITASLIVASLPNLSFGTGLSFQTLAPTVGDILTSTQEELNVGVSALFGSLSGNLDPSGTGAFTSFSQFSTGFDIVSTSLFIESTPNDVSTSVAPGTLTPGLNLWLLIDNGTEQGAFYLGETPSLGSLVSNPQLVLESDIGLGSKSGNSLLLNAVPEPSTYAALAGLSVLGFAMVRRRRS